MSCSHLLSDPGAPCCNRFHYSSSSKTITATPATPKVRPSSARALGPAPNGGEGGGTGADAGCGGGRGTGATWNDVRAPGGAGLNWIAAAGVVVTGGDAPLLVTCAGGMAGGENAGDG
jgi:hypothetical protein